jgi:hypothetical protein
MPTFTQVHNCTDLRTLPYSRIAIFLQYFKEIVSWDFRLLVYFYESNLPSRLVINLKLFEYDFKFSRILAFWVTPRYGPLLRIFALWDTGCNLEELWGHSAGIGVLRATRQILVPHSGPQHGISFESDTLWLCIHMNMVMNHCPLRTISMCMWPHIHVHVAVYPWTRGHVSTTHRILLCAMAIVQNLVICSGP